MNQLLKVIIFQMNKQLYALDIEHILSIERLQEITAVPQVSKHVKGVINLRGTVTPIIDLKEQLLEKETEFTNDTRILMTRVDGVQIGFIVDAAMDVIDIDTSIIDQAPKLMVQGNEAYIEGVAKLESGLLLILNMQALLTSQELSELQQLI